MFWLLFLMSPMQHFGKSALYQKTFPVTNVSNSALSKALCSMTPPKLLIASVTSAECYDIQQHLPITFDLLEESLRESFETSQV